MSELELILAARVDGRLYGSKREVHKALAHVIAEAIMTRRYKCLGNRHVTSVARYMDGHRYKDYEKAKVLTDELYCRAFRRVKRKLKDIPIGDRVDL